MKRSPPKRKRSCRGKVRYRDRKLAETALKHLLTTSTRQTVPRRAYFCPSCAGFHLTAQPERQFINQEEQSA